MQYLESPERNMLTKQVIHVWDQVMQYSEYTLEELRAIVAILLQLIDGSTDQVLGMDTVCVWGGGMTK